MEKPLFFTTLKDLFYILLGTAPVALWHPRDPFGKWAESRLGTIGGWSNLHCLPSPSSVSALAGMRGKQLRESTALSLTSACREDRRGGKGILPVDGEDTQPEAGRTSQTDPCVLPKKPQPIRHEDSSQTNTHSERSHRMCLYLHGTFESNGYIGHTY